MQFSARQMELARWALRTGQSEASFARDNGMRLSDVRWLFELAGVELRKEHGARPQEAKYRLEASIRNLMSDAECVNLFFAECRVRNDGKARRYAAADGSVIG